MQNHKLAIAAAIGLVCVSSATAAESTKPPKKKAAESEKRADKKSEIVFDEGVVVEGRTLLSEALVVGVQEPVSPRLLQAGYRFRSELRKQPEQQNAGKDSDQTPHELRFKTLLAGALLLPIRSAGVAETVPSLPGLSITGETSGWPVEWFAGWIVFSGFQRVSGTLDLQGRTEAVDAWAIQAAAGLGASPSLGRFRFKIGPELVSTFLWRSVELGPIAPTTHGWSLGVGGAASASLDIAHGFGLSAGGRVLLLPLITSGDYSLGRFGMLELAASYTFD